jgi:hypothetical protein
MTTTKMLGVIVSLGLSAAFIAAAAVFPETVSPTGGGFPKEAGASNKTAVATTMDVGGQHLSIPAPESFTQATTPRMLRFGELSTIKDDRLLAVFGETPTVEMDAKGGPLRMNRYALVQATRNLEPYQIPLDRFAKYKSDTKAEIFEGMSVADRAEVKGTTDSAAKWIASEMGVKSEIGIPQIGTVYTLNESPVFLTMITTIAAPVSIGDGKTRTVKMAEGLSLMLVKSKVVWLQLYTRLDSRADFDWAAKAIVEWTRAVAAANP